MTTEREEALRLETAYWDLVVSGKFRLPDRTDFFYRKVRNEVYLADYLSKYLKRPHTSILDVGAGPHTIIGKPRSTDITIDVTAVDPLAHEYDKILAQHDIIPRIRTIYGDAEKLSEQFGENVFDFVYSRNAIDHAENPRSAIVEMVKVCKPAGWVMFEGNTNEAVSENYKQLHQWNFMTVDNGGLGDCVLWNKDHAELVSNIVGDMGALSTWRTQWFRVEINKY
jgi:ubiquinone/menaquinone biosynthesis C-methylase UbiE